LQFSLTMLKVKHVAIWTGDVGFPPLRGNALLPSVPSYLRRGKERGLTGLSRVVSTGCYQVKPLREGRDGPIR
jgi:hypothetical protein